MPPTIAITMPPNIAHQKFSIVRRSGSSFRRDPQHQAVDDEHEQAQRQDHKWAGQEGDDGLQDSVDDAEDQPND